MAVTDPTFNIEVIKLMLQAAWADHRLEKEEAQLILSKARNLGLLPHQIKRVRQITLQMMLKRASGYGGEFGMPLALADHLGLSQFFTQQDDRRRVHLAYAAMVGNREVPRGVLPLRRGASV